MKMKLLSAYHGRYEQGFMQKMLKVVFLTGRPTWTQLSMFAKVAGNKAGRTAMC